MLATSKGPARRRKTTEIDVFLGSCEQSASGGSLAVHWRYRKRRSKALDLGYRAQSASSGALAVPEAAEHIHGHQVGLHLGSFGCSAGAKRDTSRASASQHRLLLWPPVAQTPRSAQLIICADPHLNRAGGRKRNHVPSCFASHCCADTLGMRQSLLRRPLLQKAVVEW